MATKDGAYSYIQICFCSDFFPFGDLNRFILIYRRSYARIYTIMEEELGGKEQFMDSYFGNYTTELAKGTLNSTMLCTVLGK